MMYIHYDNPTYDAAFERWLDVTARLIQKYGPALLDKLNADKQNGDFMTEQTKAKAAV